MNDVERQSAMKQIAAANVDMTDKVDLLIITGHCASVHPQRTILILAAINSILCEFDSDANQPEELRKCLPVLGLQLMDSLTSL